MTFFFTILARGFDLVSLVGSITALCTLNKLRKLRISWKLLTRSWFLLESPLGMNVCRILVRLGQSIRQILMHRIVGCFYEIPNIFVGISRCVTTTEIFFFA